MVADTSLDRDLGLKATRYAGATIADDWVFNLVMQQLHVFRDPTPDGYQHQWILKAQQSIHPLAFPGCTLALAECFSIL